MTGLAYAVCRASRADRLISQFARVSRTEESIEALAAGCGVEGDVVRSDHGLSRQQLVEHNQKPDRQAPPGIGFIRPASENPRLTIDSKAQSRSRPIFDSRMRNSCASLR